VYVLDPTLQEGKKLPRWEPRSRRGVFVGLSTIHASRVPLLLNLANGSITPQCHVVFDDRFSTVESIGLDESPPAYWEDPYLENTLYVPTDGTSALPVHLHDDWLTVKVNVNSSTATSKGKIKFGTFNIPRRQHLQPTRLSVSHLRP
jgi:hypothetical protein